MEVDSETPGWRSQAGVHRGGRADIASWPALGAARGGSLAPPSLLHPPGPGFVWVATPPGGVVLRVALAGNWQPVTGNRQIPGY